MKYVTNWGQDRKIDCHAMKRIVLRYKIGCYFLSLEKNFNRRKKGPIYYINHIYSFDLKFWYHDTYKKTFVTWEIESNIIQSQEREHIDSTCFEKKPTRGVHLHGTFYGEETWIELHLNRNDYSRFFCLLNTCMCFQINPTSRRINKC